MHITEFTSMCHPNQTETLWIPINGYRFSGTSTLDIVLSMLAQKKTAAHPLHLLSAKEPAALRLRRMMAIRQWSSRCPAGNFTSGIGYKSEMDESIISAALLQLNFLEVSNPA